MNSIFRKENVFTCVMFGALALFVIVESVLVPDNIAVVAFLVAISVFVLSIFKITADIAEDVNDKLTLHMKSVERYPEYAKHSLREMRDACPEEAERLILKMVAGCDQQEWLIARLRSYRSAHLFRKNVRKARRALLYTYYFVFMLLFALLLLHSEITPLLMPSGVLESNIVSVLTLWSLVLVLFEVMMKGIITKSIQPALEKKLGYRLELY